MKWRVSPCHTPSLRIGKIPVSIKIRQISNKDLKTNLVVKLPVTFRLNQARHSDWWASAEWGCVPVNDPKLALYTDVNVRQVT